MKSPCARLNAIRHCPSVPISRTAVCNQKCTNGGRCLNPGICSCPPGFVGESCEKDLDECATGKHVCKATEQCENMLNGYHCNCRAGFARPFPSGECADIDECQLQTHTCHAPAECVNTDGHFECQCPIDEPACQLSEYGRRGRAYRRFRFTIRSPARLLLQ